MNTPGLIHLISKVLPEAMRYLRGYDIQQIKDKENVDEISTEDVINDIRTNDMRYASFYVCFAKSTYIYAYEDESYDEDDNSNDCERKLVPYAISKHAGEMHTKKEVLKWLHSKSCKELVWYRLNFIAYPKPKKMYHPYHQDWEIEQAQKERAEKVAVLKYNKIIECVLNESNLNSQSLTTEAEFVEFITKQFNNVLALMKEQHLANTNLEIENVKSYEFEYELNNLFVSLNISTVCGDKRDKYNSISTSLERRVIRSHQLSKEDMAKLVAMQTINAFGIVVRNNAYTKELGLVLSNHIFAFRYKELVNTSERFGAIYTTGYRSSDVELSIPR